MIEWQPISEADLLGRIERGYAQMPLAHQKLWNAIRVQPRKWHQHPYGDAGGGFWVVGLIGPTVVWFNDIEDGFNRSVYSEPGLIEDYWCNDDDLHVTVGYLANALSGGLDLATLGAELKRRLLPEPSR